jgi:hypothetical protein
LALVLRSPLLCGCTEPPSGPLIVINCCRSTHSATACGHLSSASAMRPPSYPRRIGVAWITIRRTTPPPSREFHCRCAQARFFQTVCRKGVSVQPRRSETHQRRFHWAFAPPKNQQVDRSGSRCLAGAVAARLGARQYCDDDRRPTSESTVIATTLQRQLVLC